MEIWKDIEGYEGLYQVSSFGRVKSLERLDRCKRKIQSRILKSVKVHKNAEYQQVSLSKNGRIKNYLVHVLVAKSFIDNTNNYPCVNHKDENPNNNEISNLEWCTYRYNNNYGTRLARQIKTQTNRKDCSKVVGQYDLQGNLIAIYPSAKEAWRQTGISRSHICDVARNNPKYKTAGGYIWKYLEREVA